MIITIERLFRESIVAQRAYSEVLHLLAKWYASKGQHYAALRKLCNAYRRTSKARIGQQHLASMAAILHGVWRSDGKLPAHRNNRLIEEFVALKESRIIHDRSFKKLIEDRIRLRQHRAMVDPGRQGNLIILKVSDKHTGERGVVLLKYTPTFEEYAATFDIRSMLEQYQLVLEPSWYYCCEPSLFLFAGSDIDVVMQSTDSVEAEFIKHTCANIVPLLISAGDWVDPECFSPTCDSNRIYDVVMVASWARFKRHRVLFRALARLRRMSFRVALIGYPADLTRHSIERDIRKFGLTDQCQIFESISPSEVARIVGQSKVAVHLSKREGANKASYEALFCNTPLIVYRHNLGFQMNIINNETGMLADDSELPDAIVYMTEHYRKFHPRRWAMSNTGYQYATRVLNTALRDFALKRGRPWTRDIVCKVNGPNLRYKRDEDRLAMEPAYAELCRYLYQRDIS